LKLRNLEGFARGGSFIDQYVVPRVRGITRIHGADLIPGPGRGKLTAGGQAHAVKTGKIRADHHPVEQDQVGLAGDPEGIQALFGVEGRRGGQSDVDDAGVGAQSLHEALTPFDEYPPGMAHDQDIVALEAELEGLLHFVQNHRRLTKPLVTQMQVTSIQRVFARIQRLLLTELAARDIQVTLSVEPETLEVAVDADLLDQALINLVRNAIEALRDVPAGHVTLSARRPSGGGVVIAVADNGPGIATDQRDKIFVPFFTTKRQGSGVGLTLVRQIATAHGATVDVSQTPGGGATVNLRF
jgi:signal transduction histidine kinase